ncbi:hypothetical protein DAI22_03g359700 [Oryza sativa Japonica Group]|nr:hypothetical protein DAI22_03g359700 [Oryza sativa Japonica Group]
MGGIRKYAERAQVSMGSSITPAERSTDSARLKPLKCIDFRCHPPIGSSALLLERNLARQPCEPYSPWMKCYWYFLSSCVCEIE